MSNSMNTVSKSSEQGSMTDSSKKHLSSLTCVSSSSPVQLTSTEDLRTWLQEAFPVSRSRSQGKGKRKTTNGICGSPLSRSLDEYARSMPSLKTSLDFCRLEKVTAECAENTTGSTTIEGSLGAELAEAQWTKLQLSLFDTSEPYSETFPKAGMTRGGVCYQLQTVGLPIKGRDYGYTLPTPRSCEAEGGAINNAEFENGSFSRKNAEGVRWGIKLKDAVTVMPPRRYPTPPATDHKGAGQTGDLRDRLDYAVERGGTKSKEYDAPGDGQLNPDWVEALMGWPVGWSGLEPITTHQWDADWSEWEMDIPRVGKGIKDRAKRLKAIGNGQVPLTVAMAWKMLS